MSAEFDLERFIAPQARDYANALSEVRAGGKRTHWMWYVFPQLAGLGTSDHAKRYAISGLDEARAYLAHPTLGPRLREIAEAAVRVENKSALEIFHEPDDLKLHASATLFAQVSSPGSVFHRLLDRFFGGQPHAKSLALLR